MGAADIRLRMATQDDAQTVASIIFAQASGHDGCGVERQYADRHPY